MPASLQAKAIGWEIAIGAKVEQKVEMLFYIGKNKKLIPVCQSWYITLCITLISFYVENMELRLYIILININCESQQIKSQ